MSQDDLDNGNRWKTSSGNSRRVDDDDDEDDIHLHSYIV